MDFNRNIVSLLIVLMVIFSGFTIGPVLGEHENPEEAEEDISPLIKTLEETKRDIEFSLAEALNVNYTVVEDGDEVNGSYSEESLNRSKEMAESVKEESSNPASVLKEIPDDIESEVYLREYFLPFRHASLNLTDYTCRHLYLISNFTEAIQKVNNDEDAGAYITNSLYHVEQMGETLSSIENNVQKLNSAYFDLDNLEILIKYNFERLREYEKYIDDLREEDETTILSIYGPKTAHPGEEIEISGHFLEEGEKVSGATVGLYKDMRKIKSNSTSEGYYQFSYNIEWSQELTETQFKVEIEGRNITSGNFTVDIVRYPSNIILLMDKEAYYDETIEISGEFKTEADINLTDINLTTDPHTAIIKPETDGSFVLGLNSRRFRWGRFALDVNYSGNETISSTTENITFEVSVPTEIEIFNYTSNIEPDSLEDFCLKGGLTNVSSGAGLENQNLSIYLNGARIDEIQTDDEGNFTFYLSKDIELREGRHSLNVSFEGTEIYRDVGSNEITFVIDEEASFWRSSIFLLIALVSIGSISIALYFFWEGEEEKRSEADLETISTDSPKDIPVPTVSSGGEVSSAYRDLLEKLQKNGYIEISDGKTHREIADEMNSNPGFQALSHEIEMMTRLFEKALFTDRSIEAAELEDFNTSVKKLIREVSS